MIKVFAPASVANLSVGFDLLGIALKPTNNILLGDSVTASFSDSFSLQSEGAYAQSLPDNMKENIAFFCYTEFCKEINTSRPVKLILEKNMPIGSGLGSSASSIVASLVALNELFNKPLSEKKLLELMGKAEGQISGEIHYDNVAPSFLGGMQLILETEEAITQKIPFFDSLHWVVAYPGIKVSTSEARSILPSNYPRKTCTTHAQLLAGFIHACHTNNLSIAKSLMKDVIAEPFRKKLIPNFTEVHSNVLQKGALVCGISGSGPTLFCITDTEEKAEHIKKYLALNYIQNEKGFVHICKIDTAGAKKIT